MSRPEQDIPPDKKDNNVTLLFIAITSWIFALLLLRDTYQAAKTGGWMTSLHQGTMSTTQGYSISLAFALMGGYCLIVFFRKR